MSKPIARVVFSVLIAFALVVGVYTSVQGALLHESTKGAQAHGVSLYRTSAQQLNSFGAQGDKADQPGHDCYSDSTINPEDY